VTVGDYDHDGKFDLSLLISTTTTTRLPQTTVAVLYRCLLCGQSAAMSLPYVGWNQIFLIMIMTLGRHFCRQWPRLPTIARLSPAQFRFKNNRDGTFTEKAEQLVLRCSRSASAEAPLSATWTMTAMSILYQQFGWRAANCYATMAAMPTIRC